MGMSAADIAALGQIVSSFLPETCTIARTAVTTTCRVDEDRRDVKIDFLPEGAKVRRWYLTFPNGTDVKGGDSVTVTGSGVFTVTELDGPQSFSTSTAAFAVRADQIAALTTHTVQFRRTTSSGTPTTIPASGTGTVGVWIFRASTLVQLFPDASGYQWVVIWHPPTQFADGSQIAAGDEILWSGLGTNSNGTPRGAALSKPYPLFSLVPRTMAYFEAYT